MSQTLIHPLRSMLEVWKTLPEGTLCQLIDNKLIMSPAPKILHQEILNEINIEISIFLRKKNLGKVFIAPLDVHLSKQNILQPDILFIKNQNLHKIKEKGLSGAPDLVVEILSPATAQLDYGEKKSLYEKFGVSEYFIVDPETKAVESWFLKEGKFREQKPVTGNIKSKMLETQISF